MKVLGFAILSLLLLGQPANAREVPKSKMLITTQLNEWCMSPEAIKQQFCQAYLFGVYETTDCKFKRETPTFEELRTTFVTWVFAMKENAFVYAVESAAAAFKDKYGCE